MIKHRLVAPMLAVLLATAAPAAEPESCKTVRLAEPGWNDLAFTSGTMVALLKALGYDASSNLLGTEVIYQSLASNNLDVFLGYWDPAMITYAEPYEKDGTVERVGVNLTGAKYTFAVPDYVYDAGVHDIADLTGHADQFESQMYGIEPGSNQLMFDIIADPKFALTGWNVVESSETAMLAEVERKVANQEFVVFQGWAPHPMNTRFKMKYLTGGDAYFGPDFGAATVSTQVRKGYLEECPNVGQLLKNLVFTIDFENEGMGLLINDGMDPLDAGTRMLQTHPEVLAPWLEGVTTANGEPALAAAQAALAN
jgi:glycine betaine/proline transport system substrate-binding protein